MALAALFAAALTACGGGDDDTPPNVAVNGVLVIPMKTAAASQKIVAQHFEAGKSARAQDAKCLLVPAGYDPLGSVPIVFKDAGGGTVATLTTDACGVFSGSVPPSAASLSATPSGAEPLSQPISHFSGATPTVVSALPVASKLLISVLQDLGGGKVALTVSDSATGKAVLGLGSESFAFAVGTAAVGTSGVTYGASTAQAASVGIALDASGSMYELVGQTAKTKLQIASAAAHELISGLNAGADEAGMTIFDDAVFTMNDATLASNVFVWGDNTGKSTAPYTVSAGGLTKDIGRLHVIADLYDRFSQIYLPGGADPVHPSTGNVRLLSWYPFGGGTSFFDATSSAAAQLKAGANARRIVVAMTDGVDNSSTKTAATVVGEAKAAGVPLYMVAFGSLGSVDEPTMQTMAQQTGGEYKRVDGIDIAGLFQSIQTGIRFQYVASLAKAPAGGSTLTATVKASGQSVTRDLLIR